MAILLGGQAFIILFFLILPVPPKLSEDRQHRVSNRAASQFVKNWNLVWLFWFFLYLTLAISAWIKADIEINNSNNVSNIVAVRDFFTSLEPIVRNLINNLVTAALFSCYYILSERTIHADKNADYIRQDQVTTPWPAMIAIVIGVFAFEVLMHLILPAAEDGSSSTKLFSWLAGISSGLCMALFVGKIDSDYIVGLKNWTIRVLFFYAAIQPVWGAFYQQEEKYLELLFLNTALLLKCLLFAVIAWMSASGRLLFLLHQAREVNDSASDQWREFSAKLDGGGDSPRGQ